MDFSLKYTVTNGITIFDQNSILFFHRFRHIKFKTFVYESNCFETYPKPIKMVYYHFYRIYCMENSLSLLPFVSLVIV